MPLTFNIQATFSRILLAALVDSVLLANDLTSVTVTSPSRATVPDDTASVYIPVKRK